MSAEIETPAAMAERHEEERHHVRATTSIIRERDEQIAAWCDGKAAEAKREAEAHEAQIDRFAIDLVAVSKIERIARCEGQASAFEAVAAMLRGAR